MRTPALLAATPALLAATRALLAATAVVSAVTLAGCSDGRSPAAVRCHQAHAALAAQQQTLKGLEHHMLALMDQGVKVDDSGNPYMPLDGGGYDLFNPLVEKYQKFLDQAHAEGRVWLRVVVDNPACFTPRKVAQAQDRLSQSGG